MVAYVGIDPSFTRTGVAVINGKEIYFTSFSESIGEKTFVNIYEKADVLSFKIARYLYSICDEIKVVMECPLPLSSFSAGLYALDSLLYDKIKDNVVACYNPSTLKKLHGKKYTKKESCALATHLLNELQLRGFVYRGKKINHDQSEAFIYLCYAFGKELVGEELVRPPVKEKKARRKKLTKKD